MPKRILIVEDEFDLREMLKEVFISGGFAVDVAATGTEAVAKLKANQYDWLLTDIGLPGLTGDKLIASITDSNLKILVMSGDPADQEVAKDLAKTNPNVLKYFAKPFGHIKDPLDFIKNFE